MILRLEVKWDAAAEEGNLSSLGWGEGVLFVNDEPLWCHDAPEGSPLPVRWTWVDLLEFLASRWPALVAEQAYPFDLTPATPRDLRRRAETRWEYMSRARRLEEDETLFRFESRHDLARAMRGIQLPSLFLMREGEGMWVSTPTATTLASKDEVIAALVEMGDSIAAQLASSTAQPALEAVARWAAREASTSPDTWISYISGLDKHERTALAGQAHEVEFWELTPAVEENELLAAARLFGGRPSIEDKRRVLEAIRALPACATPLLDESSEGTLAMLNLLENRDPYQEGYDLAERWRGEADEAGRVDPEAILARLGVKVVDLALGHALDAIGCWGPRHGPAVFVNINGRRSQSVHGRRATLAHELCHLLVDRERALPFVEVLGGRSPYTPERRANAFAAELLLPRAMAAETYSSTGELKAANDVLCARFGVGSTLVAAQLLNGDAFPLMPPEEQRTLEKMVTGRGESSADI